MKQSIKHKLKANELTIGTWLCMGNTHIAEIMCNAGFDWITIDLEHTGTSIAQAAELIRIIDLCGKSPLVRLPENDSTIIKKVMDCGAHGIIVPMVKTVDDALLAYRSLRYPPSGNRGVGLFRAQGYGKSFSSYLEWVDENALLIVQIEHHEAVTNIEEILNLDEVDGYIIGPYDLSASMGIPGEFNHPKMKEALEKIAQTGAKKLKPGGIHIIEPKLAELKTAIQSGMKFIAYSVDFRMIETLCSEGVSYARACK